MGEKLQGVIQSLAFATKTLNKTMHDILNILTDPKRRQELFGKVSGGLSVGAGMMSASFLLPFIKMIPKVAAVGGGPIGMGIAAAVAIATAVASKMGMDSIFSSSAVDKKAKFQAEKEKRIEKAIERAIDQGKKYERIYGGGDEVINVYVDGKPLFEIMNKRQANADLHQQRESVTSSALRAGKSLISEGSSDFNRITGMGR